MRGSVVSFDRNKGYGFLAPENGGEDVFVHVNDLRDDKSLMVAGVVVEFTLDDGDRGPKASNVTIVSQHSAAIRSQVSYAQADPDGDELCDVLSNDQLAHELTEDLLLVSPALTGPQILDIRKRVAAIARAHGWVDH